MDTNKNSYTFMFATVMVVIVAFVLSFLATALKPKQDANLKQEKMQNILATIGIDLSREEAQVQFTNYVKRSVLVDFKGNIVEETTGSDIENGKAFTLNLASEVKRSSDDRNMPIFEAEVDGNKYFVIPLQGMGMWSDIWGNVALEDDRNTIKGVNFDHKSETSGLGAEIKTDWFQAAWIGKQILKDPNSGFTKENFASVKAVKGGASEGDIHGVDAISGGTVTSDATSLMFYNNMEFYLPYFNNN